MAPPQKNSKTKTPKQAPSAPALRKVKMTPEAVEDLDDLPLDIQGRVNDIKERLKLWPNVSGEKALQYEWKGHFRIRTGDYRVVYMPWKPDLIIIVRILHRKLVYDP